MVVTNVIVSSLESKSNYTNKLAMWYVVLYYYFFENPQFFSK